CGDGEPAWHGGEDTADYSSPALLTLLGVRQVVSVNASSVTAHNPADGRQLWSFPWEKADAKAAQPVQIGSDQVFLSAAYGVGSVMLKIRPAGAGQFTATPLWTSPRMKSKFSNHGVRDHYVYGLDDGTLA